MADDGEREPIPLIPTAIRGKGKAHAASRRDPSPAALPPAQLTDPQLDPEFRLNAVLEMSRRAWEELEEAQLAADDFGIGSLPSSSTGEDLAAEREKLRNEVRRRYNRWMELQGNLHKAESDVRRLKLERPLAGEDQHEFETVYESLKEEYGDLGAQYDLLCINCAALSVRLRRMETSGRDYESQEYTDLHKLYLSYINQLQKYTEAMKTESINRQTQEAVMAVLQVFERHFGNAHPQEWNSAVQEIRQAVEGAA